MADHLQMGIVVPHEYTRREVVSYQSKRMSNFTNETLVNSGDLPTFRLTTIQQVNRFVCGVVGIPLNLLVVVVILRSRQLWSPRNIFWLAVTFFNVLALSQAITELSLFYLYQRGDGSHQTLCLYYSTIVGSPYVLLLTALMLVTCDRYIAIVHRQLYEHYATSRNATLILFGTVIAVLGNTKLFLIVD